MKLPCCNTSWSHHSHCPAGPATQRPWDSVSTTVSESLNKTETKITLNTPKLPHLSLPLKTNSSLLSFKKVCDDWKPEVTSHFIFVSPEPVHIGGWCEGKWLQAYVPDILNILKRFPYKNRHQVILNCSQRTEEAYRKEQSLHKQSMETVINKTVDLLHSLYIFLWVYFMNKSCSLGEHIPVAAEGEEWETPALCDQLFSSHSPGAGNFPLLLNGAFWEKCFPLYRNKHTFNFPCGFNLRNNRKK